MKVGGLYSATNSYKNVLSNIDPIHGTRKMSDVVAPTKGTKRSLGSSCEGDNDTYQAAYSGFAFEPVVSTGRPGTPHCFFKNSYVVHYRQAAFKKQEKEGAESSVMADDAVNIQKNTEMRVHQHANGLCVVTVGDALKLLLLKDDPSRKEKDDDDCDWTIQFHVPETPALSAAQKRKRAAKQLQGRDMRNEIGAVRPSDTLATLGHIQLPCCVWGSVLELNHRHNRTVDMLKTDPLLKGYLAVILPTGPFPPPTMALDGSRR